MAFQEIKLDKIESFVLDGQGKTYIKIKDRKSPFLLFDSSNSEGGGASLEVQTYSETITSEGNIGSILIDEAFYVDEGDLVRVYIYLTGSIAAPAPFQLNIPVPSGYEIASDNAIGTGSILGGSSVYMNNSDEFTVLGLGNFTSPLTGAVDINLEFAFRKVTS